MSGHETDDMAYIDSDARLIFLASTGRINILDRDTPKFLGSIPPKPVENLGYYADKTKDAVWAYSIWPCGTWLSEIPRIERDRPGPPTLKFPSLTLEKRHEAAFRL